MSVSHFCLLFFFFFFNDTATTEIYTLSLHDALPISVPAYFNDSQRQATKDAGRIAGLDAAVGSLTMRDRKSTRLNSSHDQISYAVFCLKKKKQHRHPVYTATRQLRH